MPIFLNTPEKKPASTPDPSPSRPDQGQGMSPQPSSASRENTPLGSVAKSPRPKRSEAEVFSHTSAGKVTFAGHLRENVDMLKALLMGEDPIEDKDQRRDWWRAQCIFYDLPSQTNHTISQYRASLVDALKDPNTMRPSPEITKIEDNFAESRRIQAEILLMEKEASRIQAEALLMEEAANEKLKKKGRKSGSLGGPGDRSRATTVDLDEEDEDEMEVQQDVERNLKGLNLRR